MQVPKWVVGLGLVAGLSLAGSILAATAMIQLLTYGSGLSLHGLGF